MPTAICESGHLTDWRNRRGSRLADMRCREPGCGKPLRRAYYHLDLGWIQPDAPEAKQARANRSSRAKRHRTRAEAEVAMALINAGATEGPGCIMQDDYSDAPE